MKYFILFIILTISVFAHKGHKANFKIYKEADLYKMEVIFDISETKKEMLNKCGYDKNLVWCYQDHLVHKFKLLGKNSKIKYLLEESTTKENYLTLNFRIEEDLSLFKSLEIENNCFLEFDDHHINYILIDLFQDPKKFKMNKERTKITYTKTE